MSNLTSFNLRKGQREGRYPESGRLDLPYSVVLPFITIDGSRIEDELTNHASKYAYLAYFIAEAKAQTASLKNDIDAMKGALFLDAKQSATKMTDEMSKAMAAQDETLIAMRKELAKAEAVEVYWSNIMNAMQQRGFLLKELANRDFREKTSPHSLNNYNEALENLPDVQEEDDSPAYGADEIEKIIGGKKNGKV